MKIKEKLENFLNIAKRIKLNLPLAIVIVGVILSGTFYVIQINKQNSIERQQEIKIINDRESAKQKKAEEDRARDFDNELKCQTLLKDLRQRWNNVVGIRYSGLFNTCMVSYTKNGEVEEAAVEDMQDD